MRVLVASIMGAMLLGFSSPPAVATADQRMKGAVYRVVNGGWTQADLDYIKTDPEVAATVPDPTSAGTTRSKAGSDPSYTSAKMASTITCDHSFSYTVTKWSLLHSKMYTFTQFVQWCDKGYILYRWYIRTSWLRVYATTVDVVPGYYYNKAYRLSIYEATSRMDRHVIDCIPVINYCTHGYPWVDIEVNTRGPEQGRGQPE